MSEFVEPQVLFRQSAYRFLRYFLGQASLWGAKTHGPDAVAYLSIIQEFYLNVQSALLQAISSGPTNPPIEELWPLWRDAIINLYNFFDYRGLWDNLYALLSHGLEESQRRGDTHATALFFFLQARIDSNQGRSRQAWDKAEQSLELLRDIQDEQGVGNLLHFRGMLLQKAEPSIAYQSFQESLRISKKYNNADGQASTMYEIGRLEQRSGNFEKAERLYREALTIFQDLGLPREQATLLFQLGELLADVELIETARRIYKSLMDERGYAQALHQLGRAWHKRGDDAQARALYQEAIQIFERLGAPRSVRSVEQDWLELGDGYSR